MNQARPGYNIVTAGFADKVKELCYELFGWTGLKPGHFYEETGGIHLKDVLLPKLGKSPRQVWIEFGNNTRQVYDAVWAHYLFHAARCDLLIIKDLRFPTEADYVRQFGGHTVRIDREAAPKVVDGADDVLESFGDWDWIIKNDGTHGELFEEVRKLCKRFLGA